MQIPILVLLFASLALLPIPSAENHVNIKLPDGEVQNVSSIADRNPEYETYYNGGFDFAIEQLLEGPTEAETYYVDPLSVEITGESVCGDRDFSIDIEGQTAIVKFCRRVIRGGVGDAARLENSVKRTVKQFSTVDEMVLLDRNGNCLIDFAGKNECLDKLPESERR